MKKVELVFLTIISVISISLILMYKQWSSYNPHLGSMMWNDSFKTLYLKSEIQKGKYFIIIDFNYTPKELSQFSQLKIDSINFYNSRQDTIEVYLTRGGWSRSKKLPILVKDSIIFPENFCIQIYNENEKLLKTIDFEEFEKLAIANFMSSTKSFLTADEWVFTIDSTLLGLDKMKVEIK